MCGGGGGEGVFSQATVLCDFITLNLLKKRTFYREKKYEDVDVDDGFVSATVSCLLLCLEK